MLLFIRNKPGDPASAHDLDQNLLQADLTQVLSLVLTDNLQTICNIAYDPFYSYTAVLRRRLLRKECNSMLCMYRNEGSASRNRLMQGRSIEIAWAARFATHPRRQASPCYIIKKYFRDKCIGAP